MGMAQDDESHAGRYVGVSEPPMPNYGLVLARLADRFTPEQLSEIECAARARYHESTMTYQEALRSVVAER
jgi:hypothetical protein